MITGDLDRALGVEPSSAGTWRPAPREGYATSVAFPLAAAGDVPPARVAARLAARLRPLTWVERAEVTGGGYLTVTVTPDTLAGLAVRVTRAGAGCARGEALRGEVVTAPSSSGLAGARTWAQAWERLMRHQVGLLSEAAGATVTWVDERERLPSPEPDPDRVAGPVADAVAYAGADAVIFALSRAASASQAAVDPADAAAQHVANPAYAVRYAHAHAASVLRQAADLGFAPADADGFAPRLLAHPRERSLLYGLSWLPERVAGAARRGQPNVLARHLAALAEAYLSCQESCPAAWPGMAPPAATGGPGAMAPGAGPGPAAVPDGPLIVARLWLAAAARAALAAGLGLLGVGAPDRL